MTKRIITLLTDLLPSFPVAAHCDVPCGIYDPKAAQTAAATILKMVQKITETPLPQDLTDKESFTEYQNAMTRYVLTKEEHARKCKEEILILWTDYFKEEHLEQFPNLHELFWKTAKLVSTNKQEVSIKHAQELTAAVDEIANIFQETKITK